MPKQGKRVKLDGALLALMSLLVLGALIALGFLRNLTKENRALIVMASSVGILGCFAAVILISAFRRRFRKRIWLRVMSAWNERSQATISPSFVMNNDISETELKQHAIQIYTRIGYRVAKREAEDVYIQLINPEGGIELIAFKQQPDLIELHHVYSLYLEMKRIKAVRGFFWAPAGFTREAINWAIHRPIVLADGHEIGRLVDCTRAEGSSFLEP